MNLKEERSSDIMRIISGFNKLDAIEEIVDVRGMSDGFTVFVRGADGNAYEIEIRPASLAKGHDDVRGADKYSERKKRKREAIRKDMNL